MPDGAEAQLLEARATDAPKLIAARRAFDADQVCKGSRIRVEERGVGVSPAKTDCCLSVFACQT